MEQPMHLGILAAASAALVACSAPAPALTSGCADAGPGTGLASVDVVDRSTGERLPVYWHDGQRWIAGTPGHRYAVSLRNETPGRILGVISVDGINAVNGETAAWN